MDPLSESEFGELDDLLLSDDLPEECMDAVTLEGFLTAIGPVTVMPEHWLPRVFGSAPEDPMPEISSAKIFKRVVNLIMQLYYSTIMTFGIAEVDPKNWTG